MTKVDLKISKTNLLIRIKENKVFMKFFIQWVKIEEIIKFSFDFWDLRFACFVLQTEVFQIEIGNY